MDNYPLKTQTSSSRFFYLFAVILKYNTSLYAVLVTMRTFEFCLVINTHSIPENSYLFLLIGYAFDLLYVLAFTGIISVPLYLAFTVNNKIFEAIYFIITGIMLLVYLALILFFNETLIPLDSSLTAYSIKEIKETVDAAGGGDLFKIVSFLVLPAAVYVLYYIFWRFRFRKYLSRFLLFSAAVSVFLVFFIKPERKDYKFDIEYYLVNNKFVYFMSSMAGGRFSVPDSGRFMAKTVNKEISKFKQYHPSFSYSSKVYPILHKSSDYKDAIGKFFNTKKEKPNIVIFIVESLSRAFSGKNAYLGSFTPFLDSLARHSLYWENTLSTAERTFGVLPSVLASVPYGKEGFNYYRQRMPYHISLLELLSKEGYYSSFYYGGWNYFQDMGYFLDFNHINYMIEGEMGAAYNKFEKDKDGFSWGYMDEEVFRKALDVENVSYKKPRLDIFLTLNMHSPFIPPKGDYYFKMFERIIAGRNLPDKEINEYKKDASQYAAVLSTDDAIRYYFNRYKKTKDFDNTIFIITGDHRMGPIYHRSKIDKYHVPLIIYSPMLKQAKSFPAVVSHLDITPSLAAFFQNKYSVKLPANIHWLGQSLDTFPKFRSTRNLAFMRNSKELVDYLSGYDYISDGNLYKLTEGMKLEASDNDSIRGIMEDKLNNFQFMSLYLCENNRIYPQTEYLDFLIYNGIFVSKFIENKEITANTLFEDIVNTDFDNNIRSILVTLKGDINFKNNIEEPLHIVIEFKDKENDKLIKRNSLDIVANKLYNKQQGVRITKIIDYSDIDNTKNYKIKAYFWNPNKLELETSLKFEMFSKKQ